MRYFEKNSIPIEYNGRSYKCRTYLYNDLKPAVSLCTFLKRLRNGATVDEAMLVKDEQSTRSKREHKPTLYTYRGKTMSISAWARKYKINRYTLWQRLKLGWSFGKAIKAKPYSEFRYWKSNFYTYNGETHSISGWARKCKINRATLWQRLTKYGWSFEDAIRTPPLMGELATSNGETMKIVQWEKKMGYCPNTIRRRINAGWNVDDAIWSDPNELKKGSKKRSLSTLGVIIN